MILNYDQADPVSIENYGKRLLNKTLRKVKGIIEVPEELLNKVTGSRTRGSFGEALEKYYYGINPGNDCEPDFREAGVELKATPVKKLKSLKYSAKERLVLNLINFITEAEASFKDSSFFHKSAQIMLVSYLHEDGRCIGDYTIKISKLIKFSDLPAEDQKIIENDWRIIYSKIRAGKAHELSEGDTLYLSACTKGVNSKQLRQQYGTKILAKPRAYSFKTGYMTIITRKELVPDLSSEFEPAVKSVDELKDGDFENTILERFSTYTGKTVKEIHNLVGEGLNIKSKDYFAAIARRIVGVTKKRVEEFEKAEIQMKTIRLGKKGVPEESMSFPAFKCKELIEENWEDSTLIEQFEKRFLFVVYRYDRNNNLRFVGAKFWTMPALDLNGIVQEVWLDTVKKIKANDTARLTKESDNKITHLRPHGQNKEDVDYLPNGSSTTKRCFWLNKKYIKEQLDL